MRNRFHSRTVKIEDLNELDSIIVAGTMLSLSYELFNK